MQVLSWNYVISCDQGLEEESALAMLTMNGQLLECRNVLSTYWNVMQKFWFLYWKVIRATFLIYIRIYISLYFLVIIIMIMQKKITIQSLLWFDRTLSKAQELESQVRDRQIEKEYISRVQGEFPRWCAFFFNEERHCLIQDLVFYTFIQNCIFIWKKTQ